MDVSDSLDRIRTALAGRYAIERLLGQGGMALVYLARDLKHDRTVAVKVLRPELAAALGGERFLREIHLATQLQHPNILAIYDSGEADGILYFVMPFITGESLRDRLDREQQLSLPDAIRITCEVADALHYAHKQGIVHRDIKPENILQEQGHAIVADIGIARAASQAGAEKLTETGMSIGTPAYMSPEQAAGSSSVDARSDLYSLGCMLYELLAGQAPFQGPNTMAILAKHAMEPPPSIQVVRQSVPDEIEEAILQALEKTPADRFRDLNEFAEALERADLSPATRRSQTTARRTAQLRKQSRTRRLPGPRWLPWVLGLVVLAGGGLGAWHTWFRGPASPAAAGPDPNRIAVLYFETRQDSDSLRYLADGLTEALIHELSRVKPLQVISQNGVRPYRDTSVSPDSIARALNVGTLVAGTVTQVGDSLRLTVSLINGANGDEISSLPIQRPRKDIFALQDDMTQQVSNFLRQQLGQEIQLEQSRAGTRNAEAWEALQRGQEEIDAADPLIARGDTAAVSRQLDRADTLLARAQALDPKWITPVTQRGWLIFHRLRESGSLDKAYGAREIARAEGFADAAIKLDPSDPDALELRGTLRYYSWLLGLEPEGAAADRLMASAEADFRASVEANPDQASAWNSLSHLLINKPEEAEANLAARRAYELDPYLSDADRTLWRLFSTSWDLDESVQATHWCDEAQKRFPDNPRSVECQIMLFTLADTRPDIPAVWRLLDRYVELNPPNQRDFMRKRGSMLVSWALARAGLKDSARAVVVRSRVDPDDDPPRELAFFEAITRTMIGDTDDAFRQLALYTAANPQMRKSLATDPWFKPLRSDPRFAALIASGS
jgi:serine/threonine-protein kinase